MTAFLVVTAVVATALVIAGLWFMNRAGVVPAARATGPAPDPAEEAEVREKVDVELAAPRD